MPDDSTDRLDLVEEIEDLKPRRKGVLWLLKAAGPLTRSDLEAFIDADEVTRGSLADADAEYTFQKARTDLNAMEANGLVREVETDQQANSYDLSRDVDLLMRRSADHYDKEFRPEFVEELINMHPFMAELLLQSIVTASSLEVEVDSIRRNVDRLDKAVGNTVHVSKVSQLKNRVDDLEATVADLEASASEADDEIVDRLDQTEEVVAQLQDDMKAQGLHDTSRGQPPLKTLVEQAGREASHLHDRHDEIIGRLEELEAAVDGVGDTDPADPDAGDDEDDEPMSLDDLGDQDAGANGGGTDDSDDESGLTDFM